MDPSVEVDDGLVRAFGDRMETVLEPDDLEGWEPAMAFYRLHMDRFLAALSTGEANR